MNTKKIRASAVSAFAAVALVAIAAGGASASEPVTHNTSSAASFSVVHVPGSNTVSQIIHESSASGGALLGLGQTSTIHASSASGGALLPAPLGN